MIVKHRKVPILIKKLEALYRRLPPDHSKRQAVENELTRRRSGYKGEQSLGYYLNFLPDQDYAILHNLRFNYKSHFFQLDTLILSTSFFLIIEAKNISGTLSFDPVFKQLIRTVNETVEVFPDPIPQVKHQQFQLTEYLRNTKLPSIPI